MKLLELSKMEENKMANSIRKNFVGQLYFSFYFYWGFYFSAGYLSYKKIKKFPFLMSFKKSYAAYI